MLQLSLVCSVGFGMLSAASVSYTMLAITRTLTGVAMSGLSLIVLPLGECGGCGQAVGGKGIVLQAGQAWQEEGSGSCCVCSSITECPSRKDPRIPGCCSSN